MIYITKTSLCHLVEMYGLDMPALPIPNFIEISGWYQLIRKIILVVCLGIPLPTLILASGPASIIISLVTGGLGIIVLFYTKEPAFFRIPTDVISISVDSIRRRIPGQPDLVSVDLETVTVSRSKVIMPEFSKRYECSLPD